MSNNNFFLPFGIGAGIYYFMKNKGNKNQNPPATAGGKVGTFQNSTAPIANSNLNRTGLTKKQQNFISNQLKATPNTPVSITTQTRTHNGSSSINNIIVSSSSNLNKVVSKKGLLTNAGSGSTFIFKNSSGNVTGGVSFKTNQSLTPTFSKKVYNLRNSKTPVAPSNPIPFTPVPFTSKKKPFSSIFGGNY